MTTSSVVPLHQAPHSEPPATAVACVLDWESERAVRACLVELALVGARVLRADIDGAIRHFAREPSPRLIIVDISGEPEPLDKLRRLGEVCDPGTSVIVIGDRNDVVLYRGLKQLGVSEYFFKPLPDFLARACGAVLAGLGEAPVLHIGKLVVVFGVRGGVGATTIAVSAAWNLGDLLRRRVVLLDPDVCTGDAALLLDVEPNPALSDALRNPERVDAVFLENAVIRLGDRVDLLASLEPLGSPASIDETAILAVLAHLQQHYRYVFVDASFATGTRLQKLLQASGCLVLVSDQTAASARELVRWRRHIPAGGRGRSIIHVLNKARGPGALSDRQFLEAAGQRPDVVIGFDRRIASAAVLGIGAVANCRHMRFGLARLCEKLAGAALPVRSARLARRFAGLAG